MPLPSESFEKPPPVLALHRQEDEVMSTAEAIRVKQMKHAEELIYSGPQQFGVARGLFFVEFVA